MAAAINDPLVQELERNPPPDPIGDELRNPHGGEPAEPLPKVGRRGGVMGEVFSGFGAFRTPSYTPVIRASVGVTRPQRAFRLFWASIFSLIILAAAWIVSASFEITLVEEVATSIPALHNFHLMLPIFGRLAMPDWVQHLLIIIPISVSYFEVEFAPYYNITAQSTISGWIVATLKEALLHPVRTSAWALVVVFDTAGIQSGIAPLVARLTLTIGPWSIRYDSTIAFLAIVLGVVSAFCAIGCEPTWRHAKGSLIASSRVLMGRG